MFRLSNEDWEDLKRQIGISSSPGAASASKGRNSSQSVTSNKKSELMRSQIVISGLHGGRRGLPYAFTEQGIAMLFSVPRSPRKTVETLKHDEATRKKPPTAEYRMIKRLAHEN